MNSCQSRTDTHKALDLLECGDSAGMTDVAQEGVAWQGDTVEIPTVKSPLS